MKRILRLYPSAWRRRYGEELVDLLDELPPSPATTLDLLRGALGAHWRGALRSVGLSLSPAGGPPVTMHPLQRHPTALALLAMMIVAPTFAFVAISLLAYQLNVPGLAAAVDPVLGRISESRFVDLFLLGAPFLAFLLAVIPLVGVGLQRGAGELRVTLAFRARTLNLVVLVVAVLLGGLLVGHLVSEFLLEAPR